MTVRVIPDTLVVKIGGQSIIDRGATALSPILDQIAQEHENGADILICAGGGTRARSVYSLATDLRLPTGVLAALGSRVAIQNARIITTMLASRGGVYIEPEQFQDLPTFFRSRCIPVMGGMPPYGYWEMRESGSRVPPHRTDAGTFLTAEYLGAERAIFVKDEDGLFMDDPKRDPDAEHIPTISAPALAALNIADVVLERVLLDYLPRAVWCRELQIVNGLRPGEVTRALRKERNGSFITAED